MLTLTPLVRSPKLPLRIDISWMRLRPDAPTAPAAPATQIESKPSIEGADAPIRAGLIQRILELNPTAPSEFLARFGPKDLESYLQHLLVAAQPRGRSARWIRPDNTRGIAMSEPAA